MSHKVKKMQIENSDNDNTLHKSANSESDSSLSENEKQFEPINDIIDDENEHQVEPIVDKVVDENGHQVESIVDKVINENKSSADIHEHTVLKLEPGKADIVQNETHIESEESDDTLDVSASNNKEDPLENCDIHNYDNETSQEDMAKKKERKRIFYRSLRLLFTIVFFAFTALFINETVIQPYKMKNAINKAKELYHDVGNIISKKNNNDNNLDNKNLENEKSNQESTGDNDVEYTDVENTPTPILDPNRNEQGRLKKFNKLLEANDDVKGWIKIDNANGENDTKIDYVVVQSDASDPEFYLDKDWITKEYLKAGSIFLDYTSSVEQDSQNLIIHGHNMTSSDDMFHYLLEYKELKFLQEHPIISFDTIYDEGVWKVFAVVITPGSNERDDYFQFLRSNFQKDRDFIEFIYQLRVRSLYKIDDVDINEDDQILTLSTCSYELSNYRILIVARKVREGEDISVGTDTIIKNDDALYPPSFYKHYGGKAPEIPSFEEALQDGKIPWYNPIKIQYKSNENPLDR